MAGSRAADVKLIVGATVAVLLVGFFIAGAALIATRGGGNIVCNQLNIGAASDVRRTLQSGGPYFQTGGAGCGFWLALDDNDIVAYKVRQPSGCTLKLKRDHWECGNVTVPPADLVSYPVTIKTVGGVDAVIIDLTPAPAAPTTATASSLPRP